MNVIIKVEDFQCESLVDFYPEPNFEQWLHLKFLLKQL